MYHVVNRHDDVANLVRGIQEDVELGYLPVAVRVQLYHALHPAPRQFLCECERTATPVVFHHDYRDGRAHRGSRECVRSLVARVRDRVLRHALTGVDDDAAALRIKLHLLHLQVRQRPRVDPDAAAHRHDVLVAVLQVLQSQLGFRAKCLRGYELVVHAVDGADQIRVLPDGLAEHLDYLMRRDYRVHHARASVPVGHHSLVYIYRRTNVYI